MSWCLARHILEFVGMSLTNGIVMYFNVFSVNIATRHRGFLLVLMGSSMGPVFFGMRVKLYVPYVAWICINNVLAMVLSADRWGDIGRLTFAPAIIMIGVLFGAISIFVGQLMQSFEQAEKSTREEKLATESLLGMFCDSWCAVRGPKRTVVRCDGRFAGLVGQEVFGQCFGDCISNEEGQRDYVMDLLSKAVVDGTPSPVTVIPTTLEAHSGNKFRASLFVVGQRHVREKRRRGKPTKEGEEEHEDSNAHFLIGICRNMEDELADDVGALAPNLEELDIARRQLCSSEPATSVTGDIFRGLEHEATREASFAQLAELGQREHWLLDPQDVSINPDVLLGSGGYGVVVCGLHYGTLVAVKMPKGGIKHSEARSLRSLCSELRVLRHGRHENLVGFRGAILDEGRVSIVMELVLGQPLDPWMSSPGGEQAAARFRVLLGLVSALHYLHSQSPPVVHGDLKSSNLLITGQAPWVTPRLLDFGLSRIMGVRAAPLGGTLVWMAPEVYLKRDLTPRPAADIFSFGRLLFYLDTGTRPFLGMKYEDLHSALASKSKCIPEWPSKTAFKAMGMGLGESCMAADPDSRPLTEQVFRCVCSWQPHGFDDSNRTAELTLARLRGFLPWKEGLHGLMSRGIVPVPPSDCARNSAAATPYSQSQLQQAAVCAVGRDPELSCDPKVVQLAASLDSVTQVADTDGNPTELSPCKVNL